MNDNEEIARLIATGNALSQNNYFYTARHCFWEAREIDPLSTLITIAELNNEALRYRRRSNRYNRQDNYRQAIIIYQKILELSPDDVDALLSIGILMRHSNPARALKYLEKALALQPNNADIWEVKGWCHRKLKDIPSELECYYRVQKIAPSIIISRLIKGAKRRLREASKYDPKLQNSLIKILNSEGLHHVVTENYDAAVRCYKEVLRLEPESVLAQNNVIDVLLKRSEHLMQRRQFGEARDDVEHVLQINSGHEVALRCKAQEARINLMEEIVERAKEVKSVSRTASASDFWASETSGLKRGLSSAVDKDDNTRVLKQNKQ